MPENQKPLFVKPKFFRSPVEMGEKTISFELPLSILAHMEINNKEIHWTVLNGILQISGTEPQAVIPMMTNPEFESNEYQG